MRYLARVDDVESRRRPAGTPQSNHRSRFLNRTCAFDPHFESCCTRDMCGLPGKVREPAITKTLADRGSGEVKRVHAHKRQTCRVSTLYGRRHHPSTMKRVEYGGSVHVVMGKDSPPCHDAHPARTSFGEWQRNPVLPQNGLVVA